MPLEIGTLQRDSLVRSGSSPYNVGIDESKTAYSDFAMVDKQLYELEIRVVASISFSGGGHVASTGYSGKQGDFIDVPASIGAEKGTIKLYCYRDGSTLYAALHPDTTGTVEDNSLTFYSQTTQDSVEVSAGVFANLDWTGAQTMIIYPNFHKDFLTFTLDGSNNLVIFDGAGWNYLTFDSGGSINVSSGGSWSNQYIHNHMDAGSGYAITKFRTYGSYYFSVRMATIN